MRSSSPSGSICRRSACAWCRATPIAIATGAGTGGSSSIPVGGVSVDRAAKTLAEQLKQLAADALEAAPTDLEIADGAVRVAGTDRAISFADLAAHPQATPEQLRAVERVRHRAADLPERHAHRRSRDRSRYRRDRDPELRRGRRFRRHAQSAAAGRPGAWRRRAGHRPGADGRHRLRSGLRAIAQRELHGLRAAARRRRAGLRVRDAQRAVQEQSARRQRRGRGRRHRLLSGGDERDPRRALARPTHPPHRHAGDAATGLGRDRGGQKAKSS